MEDKMRLAAQAKMGYYPTPDSITPIITSYLKRKRDGLIRILDPCAGEGTALRIIGDHLKAETYGIEIDLERGKKAKQVLNECLVTDYQNTRIRHNSFSLLYLNPPYDWATRDNELESSERYERTFLRGCTRYLCMKGILVYLIPRKRLDGHIARMLSYRFEQIGIFRFPEDEYMAFKQLIIFGVLKKRPDRDEPVCEYLKNCGKLKAVVPYLPQDPKDVYEVPVSPTRTAFLFRSNEIDPEELAEEIKEHGLFDRFKEMTIPLKAAEKIKPIMPPKCGHIAQLLAWGLMNGIVWDRDKKNPMLIKGITKKETKHSVEIDGKTEKHIETDLIKILMNAFNRIGEMFTIQ